MSSLEEVRVEIKRIDRNIVDLIKKRTELAEKVLESKRKAGLPINDEAQNKVVLDRAVDNAIEFNLDTNPVRSIFKILIEMSIEHQQELSGQGKFP
ncbi:chorismate mutase [Methanomethylovorans hollandica DSM 15978]|jgi:chorismate mutase|uniref:Chorismate mutase n=1 Tax=Methanomethylovorans hollandica (strain DSM 15978 / NBRC 107637 / DMS1) TaxID=867904 RepID=L0KV14_METHD|nr:chorismate mutase [Methanomethylovorans hollandica]AGB48976.1 chorismate mutase [Methanomethylovorans hollandica DSM 15978]